MPTGCDPTRHRAQPAKLLPLQLPGLQHRRTDQFPEEVFRAARVSKHQREALLLLVAGMAGAAGARRRSRQSRVPTACEAGRRFQPDDGTATDHPRSDQTGLQRDRSTACFHEQHHPGRPDQRERLSDSEATSDRFENYPAGDGAEMARVSTTTRKLSVGYPRKENQHPPRLQRDRESQDLMSATRATRTADHALRSGLDGWQSTRSRSTT